jgi:hypothetical protein
MIWREDCPARSVVTAMEGVSRRCFLWSGISSTAPLALSGGVKSETVYHFGTRECNIRLTVEFYDRYSSKGFWFNERRAERKYCLSAEGEEGHNCLPNFTGSIAIARYRIQARSNAPDLVILRERVRTIDKDSRLNDRPPFERALKLQGGLASDIQAFGYEPEAASSLQTKTEQVHEPWCLFRQDLYLGGEAGAFLVIHWKHTLSAIRILDLIPGEQTHPMDS